MDFFLISILISGILNVIFITHFYFQIVTNRSFSRNKIFENVVNHHLFKIKEELDDSKKLPYDYNIGHNKNISRHLIHTIRCKLIEKGFIIEEYSKDDYSWLRII